MRSAPLLIEHVEVSTFDGERLATDVYRRDEGPPRPCLVQRVPYGRRVPAIVNGALDVRRAVDAGFVVVVQDCRGRGDSSGTFVPFATERDDACSTMDWIIEQDWSDGTIGMFGRSYAGLNQWLAAEGAHPALKAIAPVISGDDPDEWIRPGGVLESGFVLWWVLRYLAPEMVARRLGSSSPQGKLLAELIADPQRLLGIRRGAELDGLADVVPFLASWLEGGRTGTSSLVSQHQVPALVVAGWWDIFARSALDTFVRRVKIDGRHRLIIGPWAHGGTFSGVYPDWDAGPSGSDAAIDLTGQQLDWFRRHLMGAAGPAPAPVSAFICGERTWTTFDSWPPALVSVSWQLRSAQTGLELRSAGSEGPAGELYVDVPAGSHEPFPTRGGPTFLPGMEVAAVAGPREQGGLLHRSDVLVAHGAPCSDAVTVVGDAVFEACLTTKDFAHDAEVLVCVRLCDRAPDGATLLVAEGAAEVPASAARHHVSVRLGPIGWQFAPGHTPLLMITRSSFPRFRAPNGVGRMMIDAGGASSIVLPIREVSAQ